jgi:hypothetical protein
MRLCNMVALSELTSGNAEPVVYVMAAEDPNEAMKLVADKDRHWLG